jgi:hypothetical protein
MAGGPARASLVERLLEIPHGRDYRRLRDGWA